GGRGNCYTANSLGCDWCPLLRCSWLALYDRQPLMVIWVRDQISKAWYRGFVTLSETKGPSERPALSLVEGFFVAISMTHPCGCNVKWMNFLWINLTLLLVLLLAFPTPSFSADLMDQYLSLPGSYVFVRREPEGANSQRVLLTVFEDFLCPACYRASTTI